MGFRDSLEVVGHEPAGPAARGDDDLLERPGSVARGDDHAVFGFGDAVHGCVLKDGGAVGLGRRDGGADCAVGAQKAGAGVVDGAVVRAEVVLGVAFRYLLPVEDAVLGSGDARCLEEAVDEAAVRRPNGQAPGRREDFLPGFRFELGPQAAGAFHDGVVVGFPEVDHAEQAGVPAHGTAAVGGGGGLETHDRVGQPGGLPQGHASDAAQADDGELCVHESSFLFVYS